MPLIRLASHPKDNPQHIDKLIYIEGLPKEWLFQETDDGRLWLKSPWQIDPEANLPQAIRDGLQPQPLEVWFKTPVEVRPGTMVPPDLNFISWSEKAYGFRLDYQTNQGKQMWEQIEGLLDRETPRTERIPVPRIVGNRQQWLLELAQVPRTKLGREESGRPEVSPTGAPVAVLEAPEVQPRPGEEVCRDCRQVFDRPRALWMHRRRKHADKAAYKGVKP